MNDRFKFRLWWKDGNRYYNDDDRILHIHRSASYQEVLRMCLDDCGIIIEQCTGLKDKNGTLIYESDYVKIGENTYKVFWNKTKISLINILNGDIIDISETITMEIVGNEHEKDNISEIPKNPKRSSD